MIAPFERGLGRQPTNGSDQSILEMRPAAERDQPRDESDWVNGIGNVKKPTRKCGAWGTRKHRASRRTRFVRAQNQHRWVDAANALRHNVGTEEVLPSYLRSARVLFFALFAPAPDDDRQDDDCKNARHDTD